jgi:hypothetical protein
MEKKKSKRAIPTGLKPSKPAYALQNQMIRKSEF